MVKTARQKSVRGEAPDTLRHDGKDYSLASTYGDRDLAAGLVRTRRRRGGEAILVKLTGNPPTDMIGPTPWAVYDLSDGSPSGDALF